MAKHLGLDPSTTGMVLTNLEVAGLVRRVIGSKDRRKRSLKLTGTGERVLARLNEPARRAQTRVLSAFAPKEQCEFLRLLDKFSRTFDATTRVPRLAATDSESPSTRARIGR